MFNKNNEISFKMQLHLFYGNKDITFFFHP